jgi:hypothetical protein
VIWIITGSGKSPKRYSLGSWFIVSDIAPADNPRTGFAVRGTEGGALRPAPVLNDLPWFKGFFREMAHFSLGLQEIKEPRRHPLANARVHDRGGRRAAATRRSSAPSNGDGIGEFWGRRLIASSDRQGLEIDNGYSTR